MPAARLATCIACGSAAPLRQHRRQRRDHGIARAAHVEHLARLRRLVQHAALLVQAHALLAARDQQRLGAQFAPQRLRPRGQVVLVFPAPHHFAHFGAVGRDDGGAMVARIVVALGIDQDGLAGGAREFDHFRDMREPALAVVGQHQHVAVGEQRLEIGQLVRQHFVAGQGLEIDAQQLLLPADHAQLDRGGNARILVQAGDDMLGFDQLAQARAGLVVADHRQQRRPRAQRRRIARDVGRAAGTLLGALDLDHRHRRLGRDAAHLAEPVAIEHHVADHQQPRLGQIRQQFQFTRTVRLSSFATMQRLTAFRSDSTPDRSA